MHYNTLRSQARRAKMIEHLGGKCVKCGSGENLEFHHKNPADKSFDVSSRITDPWDVVIPEVEKCELRCEECHKKEHAGTHGLTGYSHWKCRCDICRAAWNEKCRAYKKTYREKLRLNRLVTGQSLGTGATEV